MRMRPRPAVFVCAGQRQLDQHRDRFIVFVFRRPAAAVAGMAVSADLAVRCRAAAPVAADVDRHHPALVEFGSAVGELLKLFGAERGAGSRVGLFGLVLHRERPARKLRQLKFPCRSQPAGGGQNRSADDSKAPPHPGPLPKWRGRKGQDAERVLGATQCLRYRIEFRFRKMHSAVLVSSMTSRFQKRSTL